MTDSAPPASGPAMRIDAPATMRSARLCDTSGCSRLAWHSTSAGEWRCAYHLEGLDADARYRQHEADRSRRARLVGSHTAELNRGRRTGDPLIDDDASAGDVIAAELLRPRTRGDCAAVPRPCPFIACRHSLWGEITIAGNLKRYRPDVAPWEMPANESCALDLADGEPMTLEQVARALNLTRERVRQIEASGIRRLAGPLTQQSGDDE